MRAQVREADVQRAIFFLAAIVFVLIAISDLRTRRIPNPATAAIAALGLLRLTLAGDMTTALYTLAATAAVFAATFLLFWRGLLGGGDVKLMAAAALLIGYRDLFSFLFVMSVCGALVALAVFAGDRLGLRSATTLPPQEGREQTDRLTVPYGMAIALAATLTLFVQSTVPG